MDIKTPDRRNSMIIELWLSVFAALLFLAAAFWFFGWRWESTLVRPRPKNYSPLVSILIPAYNSGKTIRDTIRSAKELSYSRKEIIVVNDSVDSTPKICRQMGVRFIQNKKRMGKCHALNMAVKKARGEILFFLDADTTIDKDALSLIIPWFSKKDIAAVSPRYVSQKSKKLLPKLVSIENSFNSSMFKADMYFGSMLSFRGCGIAIRRSFFQKVGGWSETLIEDVDFAAKTLSTGHRIQYEPLAAVRTAEAESLKELKSQRVRWGKGSAYSFLNFRSVYSKNSQFSLHYFSYIFLIFGIIGVLMWQFYLYIPILILYTLYSFSLNSLAGTILLFAIPTLYFFFAVIVTGSLGHLTIITWRENRKVEQLVLLIPYLFFYYPIVIFFYFRGMASGFSQRRYSKKEFNLDDWKC
jgi:biofilm PGA synthesis N-glycosyltransferase PgaC